MASTTPTSAPPSRTRSASRTRPLPSRPTTPLRAPSRTSLRASTTTPTSALASSNAKAPLESLEPAFGELADGMADLEANMMHLQLLHESLTRFNECFGGFLYGLNMSAFCVDFPEAPGVDSFKRADQAQQAQQHEADAHRERDVDATFLTTDTSFVDNPPTPRTTKSSKSSMIPPSTASTRMARPPASASRGRGTTSTRGTRAGGAAGTTRGTGVPRGRGRGVIR